MSYFEHDHDPLCPSNRGLPPGSSNCNCDKIYARMNKHVVQLQRILKILNPATNPFDTASGLITQIETAVAVQTQLAAGKASMQHRIDEQIDAQIDYARYRENNVNRRGQLNA